MTVSIELGSADTGRIVDNKLFISQYFVRGSEPVDGLTGLELLGLQECEIAIALGGLHIGALRAMRNQTFAEADTEQSEAYESLNMLNSFAFVFLRKGWEPLRVGQWIRHRMYRTAKTPDSVRQDFYDELSGRNPNIDRHEAMCTLL